MIKPLKRDTSTCAVVGCFHVLEGKIVDGRAQQLLFWVHVSELNSAVCQRLNQTYFLGGEANLWDFMNLLSRQLCVLAKQMSVGKRVRALLANNDYCCCKEIIWGDDRGHPRLFAWILLQASSLRLEKKQNGEFLQLRQLQMIDVCNCCLVIAPNDSCATKAFWYKPHLSPLPPSPLSFEFRGNSALWS